MYPNTGRRGQTFLTNASRASQQAEDAGQQEVALLSDIVNQLESRVSGMAVPMQGLNTKQ